MGVRQSCQESPLGLSKSWESCRSIGSRPQDVGPGIITRFDPRRRIIGSAELKARNLSLQVLEETVNRVFDESLKKMEDSSSMKNYGKSLKKFLEEGVDAIGVEEFTVVGRSADKDLLKKVSHEVEKEHNVTIKVASETLESRGGVQVKSSDGSVIYDNTIEARLERLKPLLRKQISEILVGQG